MYVCGAAHTHTAGGPWTSLALLASGAFGAVAVFAYAYMRSTRYARIQDALEGEEE